MDKKDIKDLTRLSMDNMFMLLWAIVLLSVFLVTILGQFLTTLLLCVAIVAFINKKMSVETSAKKPEDSTKK